MAEKSKNPNRGLIYVILLCFVGLLVVTYFLVINMSRVRELSTHKDVLIKQLAEEVSEKKAIQKELDSLKEIMEAEEVPPISNEVQEIIP